MSFARLSFHSNYLLYAAGLLAEVEPQAALGLMRAHLREL